MSDFYANLQATATKLLTSRGQQMTHRRKITYYDQDTGVATTIRGNQQCFGIVVSGKQVNQSGNSATKSATRLMLTADTLAIPPMIGDEIIDASGLVYTITIVDNIAPAGEVVVWELEATSG